MSSPPLIGLGRAVALGAIGGLVIGVLTSVAQGLLPFELNSLANSAGAWCLAAFALALVERSPVRAAIIAALALAAMLIGYLIATSASGQPVSSRSLLFWGAAALLVGPFLGVGAAWWRGSLPVRAGLGMSPIAGILLGEGVYGLTVIAETTSAVYWSAEIAVGLGLLIAASLRLRSAPAIAVMCAATAIVSVAFYVVYTGDLLSFLP